jgi:hypothetical protein
MRTDGLWAFGCIALLLTAIVSSTISWAWWVRVFLTTLLCVASLCVPWDALRAVLRGSAIGLVLETVQSIIREREALQVSTTFAPTHASHSPHAFPTLAPTTAPTANASSNGTYW